MIQYEDEDNKRTIWNKSFELIACKECGKQIITRDFAEALSSQRNIPEDYFELCDECHRRELSVKMGSIVSWSREAAS